MSDLGRVRSWARPGRWGGLRETPHVLSPAPNSGGHLTVVISGRSHLVHRLVLFAFVGSPPPGRPDGAHGNGDPADNRLANLRWASEVENSEDSRQHGTLYCLPGEAHPRAKLTWAGVREIRSSGEHVDVLAARLGVSKWTVYSVRNGRTWREEAA